MATVSKWTPFGVALDITATAGTVTRTFANEYTVVINVSWKTYYSGAQTNYGMSATSGGVTKTISSFGTKRSSGSASFTGTYSISGNGSATKTITVTFKNYEENSTGSVTESASKSVSFNVSVPAWPSYKITYNANGGSGAPSAQTKWKDQTLTLSSTKPTKTGHSFLGWSTSSTATSATYTAGGSYKANSAATLYAVWKANTYTITYNPNGGTGGPTENDTKTYGKTLTLSSTIPTRVNYNFLGWSTSATATTATYKAGGSYTANSGATLYAVWETAYTKPKISSFSVTRSDDGVNAIVSFKWSTFYYASKVLIEWIHGSTVIGSKDFTPTANAKSGTINDSSIGNGELDTDLTYVIRVTVEDQKGQTKSSKYLPGAKFPIDVLVGGKGIAFNKPAEEAGYMDVNFKTKFRDEVEFENHKCIYGTSKEDATQKIEAFDPINESGNTVVGYGNYLRQSGNSHIYGYDVQFGVSSIATPGTFRPYLRKGDSVTVSVYTAGYVTNSKKDVAFFVPLTRPIVGSPTISVSSGNGLKLRQAGNYTHGSSASASTYPDTYEATLYYNAGLYVLAKFPDTNTTNAVNNETIGVYFNGTITLT